MLPNFIIDLESFGVEAKNEEEAREEAIRMMRTGEHLPKIDGVVLDDYDEPENCQVAGCLNIATHTYHKTVDKEEVTVKVCAEHAAQIEKEGIEVQKLDEDA